MVHRWATDCVHGKRVDPSTYETEGLESDDPVLWLRDGGLRLIEALKEAPADLEALVFLNDAPRPGCSGPGASATRPPSTRSTRSRRRSAGCPRPTRPG